MTLDEWITNWLLPDTLAGQRVGQSYLNRVHPGVNNPDLFYETNVGMAWVKIRAIEEEGE